MFLYKKEWVNVWHWTGVEQCFITRWNTSTFVKNTPLRVVFSTLFLVFHLLVMKHCVSRLKYNMKIESDINALVSRSELLKFDQSMKIESDILTLQPLSGTIGLLQELVTWSTFFEHENSSLLNNCISRNRKSILILSNLWILSCIPQKQRLWRLPKSKIFSLPLMHMKIQCDMKGWKWSRYLHAHWS